MDRSTQREHLCDHERPKERVAMDWTPMTPPLTRSTSPEKCCLIDKVTRLPTIWSRWARFSKCVIQYLRHIIWQGTVRLIGLYGLGVSTPNVLMPFSTSHRLPASSSPGYWLRYSRVP